MPYFIILVYYAYYIIGKDCKDAWKDLPQDWLEGLDIKAQVSLRLGNDYKDKNSSEQSVVGF